MAKESHRIVHGMSLQEILHSMAAGNASALECMKLLLADNSFAYLDILMFDSMQIYGEELSILWKECCSCDMAKFKATIELFRKGRVSERVIHEKLSQENPKPFLEF